jgi:hypothetical protein
MASFGPARTPTVAFVVGSAHGSSNARPTRRLHPIVPAAIGIMARISLSVQDTNNAKSYQTCSGGWILVGYRKGYRRAGEVLIAGSVVRVASRPLLDNYTMTSGIRQAKTTTDRPLLIPEGAASHLHCTVGVAGLVPAWFSRLAEASSRL